MTAKARLKQIAEEIGALFDENTAFFDRKTGDVVVVLDDMRRAAEEGCSEGDVQEWQRDLLESTIAIGNDQDGRYLPLPNKYDFHEYEVMERFCQSRDDDEQADGLFDAIRGRGAFRRFKDKIHQFGIQQEWYRFRDEALMELAADWAEEHGIEVDRE
ncbi:MAG: hypothetical protein HQL95_08345 [Magnetococcales bacterium]|nr:hypothetical protein [Magnetococcales bacterium]